MCSGLQENKAWCKSVKLSKQWYIRDVPPDFFLRISFMGLRTQQVHWMRDIVYFNSRDVRSCFVWKSSGVMKTLFRKLCSVEQIFLSILSTVFYQILYNLDCTNDQTLPYFKYFCCYYPFQGIFRNDCQKRTFLLPVLSKTPSLRKN